MSHTDADTIRQLYQEFIAAKAALRRAEEELKLLTELIVKTAEQEGSSELTADLGGGSRASLTVVRSERVAWDEQALESALGEELWDRVTTRKVQTRLLQDVLLGGEVANPQEVAAAGTPRRSSPYILASEKMVDG